ncbi:unnamed protein product, partial [Prorocentrum cordatum]
MALEPGITVFLNYGDALYHERILLAWVVDSLFIVITPDFDVYIEQIDASNPDLEALRVSDHAGSIPFGLTGAQLYRFRARPAGADLVNLMAEGRHHARVERAARGLAPPPGQDDIIGPGGNAPAVVPIPLPVPPPVAPGVPAVPMAPRVAGAAGAWVFDEPGDSFAVGQEFALPANALDVGGRTFVSVNGKAVSGTRVAAGTDLDGWARQRQAQLMRADPRVLPRPAGGEQSAFVDDVRLMKRDPSVPIGIKGPATLPDTLADLRKGSTGGFTAAHDRWLVDSKPFDGDRVSLPPLGKGAACLSGALDPEAAAVLQNFETDLLASPDVVEQRRMFAPAQPYLDLEFRASRPKYIQFLSMLKSRGIISLVGRRRGSVTPFFVSKKNGKQRLVLDCRLINILFHHAPVMEIGALDCLSGLEVPRGRQVFTASADIEACFYQCGGLGSLIEFFCLPGISVAEATHLGFDVTGLFHDAKMKLHVALNVLPMGWSWAFWFVQRVHLEMLRRAGIDSSRLALGGWPLPLLEGGPVELPYSDNVNVIGLDPVAVGELRDKIVSTFERHGFAMHEISPVSDAAVILGASVGGSPPSTRRVLNKLLLVRGALQWLASGPTVTGRQVEVIVGHYVALTSFNRLGLSVMRSLYDFIRDKYVMPTRLWASCRYEAWVMADVSLLLSARLDRPWSPVVTASDAANRGMAVCEAVFPVSAVASVGRWRERWRYRRLNPDEWAPRFRWIPSEFNPADAGSRLFEHQGPLGHAWSAESSWRRALAELRGEADSRGRGCADSGPHACCGTAEAAASRQAAACGGRRVAAALSQASKSPASAAARSHCEEAAAGAATRANYRPLCDAFLDFCQTKGRVPADVNELQIRLLEALDHLLGADGTKGDADTLVAAVKDHFPFAVGSGTLPRVTRALRGFGKKRPPRSRAPAPKELMAAAVSMLLALGLYDQALQVAVLFYTYIRPGALRQLTASKSPASAAARSHCEEAAAGAATRANYRPLCDAFLDFCQTKGRVPADVNELQIRLLEALDHLLGADGTKGDADTLVAAVKDHFPFAVGSGTLPRVTRALRGFGKKRPPRSRAPAPKELMAAAVSMLLALGLYDQALQVAVLFYTYIRPGALRQLTVGQLLPPARRSGPLSHWSIILAPTETVGAPRVLTKTGTSDETVLLDEPAWLGPVLQAHARGKPPTAPLFTTGGPGMAAAFGRAVAALGVPGVCLYQLRHGGASDDLLTQRRPADAVKARGHWKSESSLRRYAKPGAIHQLLNAMPAENRAFGVQQMNLLERLLKREAPGSWAPRSG